MPIVISVIIEWSDHKTECVNHVYSPPARGLLIHCECPVAGAGAGVECCWKPGGRRKMLKDRHQRNLKQQPESCLRANGPNLSPPFERHDDFHRRGVSPKIHIWAGGAEAGAGP